MLCWNLLFAASTSLCDMAKIDRCCSAVPPGTSYPDDLREKVGQIRTIYRKSVIASHDDQYGAS